MAGITMSPQSRESPETANFQERLDRVCAASKQEQSTTRSEIRRIRVRL
jgi:hypothetical protein